MADSLPSSRLDQQLRLHLAELPDRVFEQFFLHFLNAGIRLVVERNGERIERRVIEANTYAAGSGRADKGVDLIAKMEGGETWAFQCKRVKTWSVKKSEKAVKDATYPAQHYFLIVSCDPHKDVQDFMAAQFPDWSFWNLDRICQEFRMRVPSHQQAKVVQLFLSPEDLRRLAPYANEALVSAKEYFHLAESSSERPFVHRFRLVGRNPEMAELRKFVADRKAKVIRISAKGGEGKSRLLLEFATVVAGEGAPEVLFLNPQAMGDLVLENWNYERSRIIVVDDAHRVERLSPELFTLVRIGEATKLVLATRPQGREAIDERLRDQGLAQASPLDLLPLAEKDLVALAAEALGDRRALAKDLVRRASRSPFLITVAGHLIGQGRMSWADWQSDQAFREELFRCFEKENLAHLSEADRKNGKRLLRLVSLVSPVLVDAVFYERAARCLAISKIEVEDLLRRLQGVGLVASETRDVRVLPDLFADFLVFDTVFDPRRSLPEFARTIFEVFLESSAAMVRNLAEASWVAGLRSVSRYDLMRPLLEAEFARIDSDRTSFFECGRVIEHWATFSVFLAEEALELARRVLAKQTAPRLMVDDWIVDQDPDGIDSRAAMLSSLPALLKPIALWRDDFRAAALDLLWELGAGEPTRILTGGSHPPWGVIATAVAFAPRKPPQISLAVLEWVSALVQRESVQREIENNRSVLGVLLKPCFDRFVHVSEWEGRTLRWWDEAITIESTVPVRERALGILQRIIDHGSWLQALDAVRALAHGVKPIPHAEGVRVRDLEGFLVEWRPERRKALAVLRHAGDRHTHPVLRFGLRQMLLQYVAYDGDEVFKEEMSAVLATIPDDLDQRLLSALLTQGYFEFAEELGAPKGGEQQEIIRERWQHRLREVSGHWLRAHPTVELAVDYLEQLVVECERGGYSPSFGNLLPVVARRFPQKTSPLVEAFLQPSRSSALTGAWHHLLFGLGADESTVRALLQRAASDARSKVRRGVIDYFCFRDRREMSLRSEERRLLEGMAQNVGGDEAMAFVQLVKWTGPTCAAWAFELLQTLPLEEVSAESHGEVLAALNPFHAPNVVPPLAVVEHVLDAIVAVPEVDTGHFGGGYERVRDLYPRAVFDFVVKRIAHLERLEEGARYQAIPDDGLVGFRLPGLRDTPDFLDLCRLMRNQEEQAAEGPVKQAWRELFQALAIDEPETWLPRLISEVGSAKSLEMLGGALELIHFDGSLIVFRFPELTSTVLRRAQELDGEKGYERLRSRLYHISGPTVRGGSNGELDASCDYLEAEARKAASEHRDDPVLARFFRWVADMEKHERDEMRRRYRQDIALLDD